MCRKATLFDIQSDSNKKTHSFYVDNHNNHADTGNREGRELDCYCVPKEQCPSSSVMNPFGLTSNHIQNHNQHHNNHHNNHITNLGNAGQRPAREQLPDPTLPVKDYSNLINPRILPKDIVAVGSNDKEDAEDHDTLDLTEKGCVENNSGR